MPYTYKLCSCRQRGSAPTIKIRRIKVKIPRHIVSGRGDVGVKPDSAALDPETLKNFKPSEIFKHKPLKRISISADAKLKNEKMPRRRSPRLDDQPPNKRQKMLKDTTSKISSLIPKRSKNKRRDYKHHTQGLPRPSKRSKTLVKVFEDPIGVETPKKRGVGRPRKYPISVSGTTRLDVVSAVLGVPPPQLHRRKGAPRRKPGPKPMKSRARPTKRKTSKSKTRALKAKSVLFYAEVLLDIFFEQQSLIGPFLAPVDPKKHPGCEHYLTIIGHPMDFGTIKKRFDKGYYKPTKELPENIQASRFVEDIRLVFENAITFNSCASEVYQNAQKLQEMFEDKLQELKLPVKARPARVDIVDIATPVLVYFYDDSPRMIAPVIARILARRAGIPKKKWIGRMWNLRKRKR